MTSPQLAMLAGQVAPAIEYGKRAIEIAHALGDVETECHALNNVGAAQLAMNDESGRAQLERSVALALALDLHEHVARAYVNHATNPTGNPGQARCQIARACGHGSLRAWIRAWNSEERKSLAKNSADLGA